ncbi:hypothetical protein B0T26DRAFT_632171 [Lasiosphaeria miniovina]|uniref:FHA domain-containing protein n=1 Tax=Lasiosphaeria miniovina TaxID=1954250 RepID=A0AA40BGE8_9PEZI|nr:uncharacterized protein B0T26DRAFT_632171 [Lasiosphaeria miniovina]KAK0733757.1 hypothetical protein B0T26DRAFT_632171 [Lasiosphaeria miniovina]
MFMSRKTLQRTNSSSSVSSTSSNSSTSTVTSNAQPNGNSMPVAGDQTGWPNTASRKRPQTKGPWLNGKPEASSDFSRATPARPPMSNGMNGASALHPPQSILTPQNQILPQNGMPRPGAESMASGRQPVLSLLSLNGSFDRKTISVPFLPDTLRIGRQTNAKTVPTPLNGFFDSKVLSRQHAEVWADSNGKIWIRDVKSSNGTFVNGTRLSPENRESEPHELQTQDHLELGIDIVSEDQKTVVHHKVAAKVEHAGYITPTNNLIDMNLGDLDPSSSTMMLPLNGLPFRGRAGSQASMASNSRVVPGNGAGPANNNSMAQQRQFWLNPITTEHIVKKLHNEMRNARLQTQDLARTSQFINALLSKEDVKNQDKPEAPEPPKTHMTNGNVSFRSDGGKTRFSEPPAPPPSQPLPEKPDVARPISSDIPSLKRGITERPKSHPSNTSPIRPDNNLSQILQLTEELNKAKKELDDHSARVRDLEEKLIEEREARQHAEEMVQKMEESSHVKMNGSAGAPLANGHAELERAFDPPAERPPTPEPVVSLGNSEEGLPPQPDKIEALAAVFQARIDSMASEMMGLRDQVDAFRQRAEKAEVERDQDRKTLAEMVIQIRQRDEKEKQAAERKSRSPSSPLPTQDGGVEEQAPVVNGAIPEAKGQIDGSADDLVEVPTLSRANTITPAVRALAVPPQDPALIQTLPYASMIGVVLIGMGLMAYLNGWQHQPRLER